jgi:hypothetical protein
MKSLRIIRDRAGSENNDTNSLRGLEDHDLFHSTGIVVHLLIAPQDENQIRSVAETYGLVPVAQKGEGRHVSHWTAHWRLPGTHKKQALNLFFAAMELHRRHAPSRTFIYQTLGLSETLVKRLEGITPSHSSPVDHFIQEWLKGDDPSLSLHSMVGNHLVQAGIPIEVGAAESMLRLTSEQIAKLHQSLAQASHHEQSQKKQVG